MFPFWLVNLMPAPLSVRLGIYVLVTAAGIVPGTLVYVLVGDSLGSVLESGGEIDLAIIYEPRFLLPLIGLAILVQVPVVYRKMRRRRRRG